MAGHTTVGGGGGGGGSSESSLFAPRLSFDDENHPTLTSEEQASTLPGRFLKSRRLAPSSSNRSRSVN